MDDTKCQGHEVFHIRIVIKIVFQNQLRKLKVIIRDIETLTSLRRNKTG